MEVALRRPAVADVRNHNGVLPLELQPPCEAGRMRKLGCQRDLCGKDVHAIRAARRLRDSAHPDGCQALSRLTVANDGRPLAVSAHDQSARRITTHGIADTCRLA